MYSADSVQGPRWQNQYLRNPHSRDTNRRKTPVFSAQLNECICLYLKWQTFSSEIRAAFVIFAEILAVSHVVRRAKIQVRSACPPATSTGRDAPVIAAMNEKSLTVGKKTGRFAPRFGQGHCESDMARPGQCYRSGVVTFTTLPFN